MGNTARGSVKARRMDEITSISTKPHSSYRVGGPKPKAAMAKAQAKANTKPESIIYTRISSANAMPKASGYPLASTGKGGKGNGSDARKGRGKGRGKVRSTSGYPLAEASGYPLASTGTGGKGNGSHARKGRGKGRGNNHIKYIYMYIHHVYIIYTTYM